jgi:entericidin B
MVNTTEDVKMKTVKILAALALVVGIAGCNTVKGAGKDIERGGEAVQNTATEVQQEVKN